MTLQQMIRVLWARRWFAAKVFFSVVALVTLASLLMTKKYLAEASVVIDSKATDPVTGAELQSELLPTNLATQIDVVTSHAVALKVVDKLQLTSIPDISDAWEKDTEGKGSIRDWVADFLIKKCLKVNPSASISNVITIGLLSPDPNLSAALANAWAEAFAQTSLELKSEPARRQAKWFDEQVLGFRSSLETAQKRLSDYQRENSVIGTDVRVDVENDKLNQLSSALLVAQSSMYDGQAKLRQMNDALKQGRLSELPDILGNPMLQGMTADLGHAQANLAQAEAHFGHNHPQYQSAAGQVSELRKNLDREIDTARGSIEKTTELGEQRVDELKKAIDQQRDSVLGLKRQQDDINVMRSDVDSAQRAYDAAVMRSSQVQLEGRLDQGNVSILGSAVTPVQPARPKILLNIAVSIVFGLMFGIAMALAAELRDRRLRGIEDLEAAGMVVLTVVPVTRVERQGRFARLRGRLPLLPKLQRA